jgi:hypothetical protein
VYDAGAALAGVAADMGPGEVEVIPQELDQQRAVLDVDGNGLAVHRQFDCRHGTYLPGLILIVSN